MLFNSAEFLIWFLPATLIVFFLLGRTRPVTAMVWLIAASIFFYGWWRIEYVFLLVGSVLFNFAIGFRLSTHPSRILLAIAIASNLVLLGIFKYAAFFLDNVNFALGTGFSWASIALPLGISFFTFQQIAYLVDAHQGQVRGAGKVVDYALFVTFFPQLIAGPIVHHKEMMPQFAKRETFRPRIDHLTIGLTMFAIGLFKKVVIADNLAIPANHAFDSAAAGHSLRLAAAWMGSVAFTLQLYFDFSGYSEMALGLARMVGINIPINFDSPFKARNVIEFWQRWHISLTRFFTAYLYNPLLLAITRQRVASGKQLLKRRKVSADAFVAMVAVPTLITMFLTGVWHGAGWQFAAFGLLHGVYIVVNHAWRAIRGRFRVQPAGGWLARGASVVATFLAVNVSLVFFRAQSVDHAFSVLAGMLGLNGISLPRAARPYLDRLLGQTADAFEFGTSLLRFDILFWEAALLLVCWTMPNTLQWMKGAQIGTGAIALREPNWGGTWIPERFRLWSPSPIHAVIVGLFGFFVFAQLWSEAPSQFLYFNF